MVCLGNDWDDLLAEEFQKEYYRKLRKILIEEYNTHTIYPGKNDIFNALKLTPYNKVKVVVLGQDPYHGEGQAHGLSFSVRPGVSKPPSLKNIFLELKEDVGVSIPQEGTLTAWAEQGVLLLNTILTVRAGEPGSHKKIGWNILTDKIISLLGTREEPIGFLLWGAHACQKSELLSGTKHLILKAPHPSPLSVYKGFFGCHHFSKVNEFLQEVGQSPINWEL